MISLARKTPVAIERYVQIKIKMFEKEIIKPRTTAQQRICYYRKHQLDTYPSCTIKEKDNHNIKKEMIVAYNSEDFG